MKNPLKLKELIIEKVDLAQVMLHYNVKFAYSPEFADEAQFSCPFHGADNKPSARYYRATKSCYCWVCRKKWDVVGFVREKESLSFNGALNYIIDWYKLDTSGISDDPEFVMKKRSYVTIREWSIIDSSAVPTGLSFTTPEIKDPIEEKTIRSIMLRNKVLALHGKIPFEKYNTICTAYYMIMFEIAKGEKVLEKMNKLESKLDLKV